MNDRHAGGDALSPDEYAVYAEVLRPPPMDRRRARHPRPVPVVMDTTRALPDGPDDGETTRRAELLGGFPEVQPLFARFDALNRRAYRIEPLLPVDGPCHLLSEDEHKALFGLGPGDDWSGLRDVSAGWGRFRAQFPGAGGRVQFSRAAIDAAQSLALVYYEIVGDELSGWGGYKLLRRQESQWQIAATQNVWIS